MENRAPKTDTILRKLVDEVEQSMQSIIRATNAAALPTGQDSELGSSDDDDYDDSSDDLGSLSISSLSEETLCKCLAPVVKKLERVDVKALLAPPGNNGAARQNVRTPMRPIHNMIIPSTPSNVKGNYVRYLHVTESEAHYSIGVFVFPPNATIPLHDHPGMCVLSRVLYGDLHVKSYDIIDITTDENDLNESTQKKSFVDSHPSSSSWFSNLLPSYPSRLSPFSLYGGLRNKQQTIKNIPAGSKHARRMPPKMVSAPQVLSLFPLKGNMHEFCAGKNGAAVLDVLMPPYDDDDDRDCTFYREEDFNFDIDSSNARISSTSSDGGYSTNDESTTDSNLCLLVPVNQPRNFHCVGGRYGSLGTD